jgi:hypothetical protein
MGHSPTHVRTQLGEAEDGDAQISRWPTTNAIFLVKAIFYERGMKEVQEGTHIRT